MQTVLNSLNQGLHAAFATDERVILLGEDVLDPYGGAFKVTSGLSSAYPGRVFTTPISEAGIVGAAAGMAMRGLRPVVEIMFGDFITLAADALVNHAAKFRWMYNDQVRVPLVLRTPMGGRRGYGPTHSQTLEKMFLGVPGLNVIAPTTLGNPGDLLRQTILQAEDPTLFIENKLQYLLPLQDSALLAEFECREIQQGPDAPAYTLTVRGAPPPVLTIAAYGYMAELARQALLELAYEHEVFAELVVLTRLTPFGLDPVFASARRTGALMTVEEGTLSLGWGAEVLAQTAEALGNHLLRARRLAALDTPVPASGPLENQVLPGVNEIMTTALELIKTHV
ncbi:MAG: alpha-ketoacid dehydrogenase subunit beta [Chloroflexi bacterium]|jgi:pyruvate/2-oxoglutarate/acetoin dehydrogenase E1 component|nr:alpha-ketoacid dehydrogenase subunit beta [Chloroflexota bacterium]